MLYNFPSNFVFYTKVRNHEFECKLNEEFSHEVPELGGAMNVS